MSILGGRLQELFSKSGILLLILVEDLSR